MKKETLIQKLAKQNISLMYWANNKGLNKQDKQLLLKISNGTTNGVKKGRTRELVEMLKKDGLVA